jgi:hypothetical protein
MKSLLREAERLNVVIEVGNLPRGEAARYVPSSRRIIVNVTLDPIDAWQAIAIGLGHAHHSDTQSGEPATARAKSWAHWLLATSSKDLPDLLAQPPRKVAAPSRLLATCCALAAGIVSMLFGFEPALAMVAS